jgi:hypothetical protein
VRASPNGRAMHQSGPTWFARRLRLTPFPGELFLGAAERLGGCHAWTASRYFVLGKSTAMGVSTHGSAALLALDTIERQERPRRATDRRPEGAASPYQRWAPLASY